MMRFNPPRLVATVAAMGACLLWAPRLPAAIYHVDPVSGSDANDGAAQTSAWRSLAKVNATVLAPGDVVRLARGAVWREQLNLGSSGTAGQRVVVEAYGPGAEPPTICGAELVAGGGLVAPDAKRYAAAWPREPRQVFFNGRRGVRKTEVGAVTRSGDWCHSAGMLYYWHDVPGVAVEATVRTHAVNVTASHVIVAGLRVCRTEHAAVRVSSASEGVTLDALAVEQWTDAIDQTIGGVTNFGRNTTIARSTFGRTTGDDLADQTWAGFVPIVSTGANATITGNKVYHNSLENESGMGRFACGIKIGAGSSGRTEVADNLVYHVGANAIFVIDTMAQAGDRMLIHHNRIEYSGQAGISLYRTRTPTANHASAEGHVHHNEVSYANRLGGAVGGGYVDAQNQGNRAAGIHFNDGARSGANPAATYLQWYCYENEVHHSQSPGERNSPDSDGIAIDFNANGVHVFRNRVHDCDGKGMYIWNANHARIYYNLIYGNDAGIIVTSSGGVESSNGNQIHNNTLYKNFNGTGIGKDYHTEVYFGLRGNDTVLKNNILYAYSDASAVRYAYYFSATGSTGCVTDFNLVYSEAGDDARVCYDGAPRTFAAWKAAHAGWDAASVFAAPQFVQASAGDFTLTAASPAIDRGTPLGYATDFLGRPLIGTPDLGAVEHRVEMGGIPGANPGRISNFSVRAEAAAGEPLLAGIVIADGRSEVLVRAVGPGLALFGVGNPLPDPVLRVTSASGTVLTNDGWSSGGDATGVAETTQRAGAFSLTPGSRDAALVALLEPGSYAVQVMPAAGTSGVALIEAYAVDPRAEGRLRNVSVRMGVGTGERILILGFVIAGDETRTLLIRGIGPGLAPFGVTGALLDPQLSLYGGAVQLARNDNWEDDNDAMAVASAAGRVGAFALGRGAKDAAVVVTLPPGAYTVQISGVAQSTGVALVEVYEVG